MQHNKLNLIILTMGAMLSLTGCLGPGKSSPTRFYVLSSLNSMETKAAPVTDLKNVAIGVGPVRIPGALDRSQIVIRTAQNEIRLAEFAEWGDPLGASFSRVLAENLSILLNTENITIYPYMKATQTDYQVTVDINDFIGIPGGNVQLSAWWTVFGESGRTALLKRYTNLNEPSTGDDIAAMVKAQSRTVETLSRQIADAIKTLSQHKKQGKK